MANADDFCQFARLGQTMKIQKCLQAHRVDVNALNLFGESALSTATYYNQILCVEYLLANRADPKLRLPAGHTAIHVACRLGNVPILQMLLSLKKEDRIDDEQQQLQHEEKHLYSCLRIKDNAGLTPVHWAATQESVSKRQKLFAYLDRRMPGVLDSRYNLNWFDCWAKLHPWVIEQKSPNPPARPSSILKNNEKLFQSQIQDEPSEITSLDLTPKGSNNNYERTPRAPLLSTTMNQYNNTFERKMLPSTRRRTQIETPSLPITPTTSCKVTVTSIYHIPKRDQKLPSPAIGSLDLDSALTSERTPNSAIITNEPMSTDLSDRFTYRARRVHIEPVIHFPPPPSDIDEGDNSDDEMSSKRPSHNLLSNIVPSVNTPSSEHSSSQPSTKQYTSSFGFDANNEQRPNADTTMHSISDTYAQNDELQSESSDDDDKSDPIDYICKSTSTLGAASPGAYTYYVQS